MNKTPQSETVYFIDDDGEEKRMVITYGLNYIKGNHAPYFSITAYIYKKGIRYVESCGCLHDKIHEHAPEFDELITMHLSDINGEPMYAVENGWYWYHQSIEKGCAYIRIPPVEGIENKEDFADVVGFLRPLWKREANALIEKFDLKVFGDTWPME